jgi:shikimate kinase
MRKPFVVISGLPRSGKTTLGRRLAPALNLPFIDKDDILAIGERSNRDSEGRAM